MPAFDPFQSHSTSMESPVSHAFDIAPDDAADLSRVTRAVYVGGAGNLAVTMADGSKVTFVGLSQGWQPIRVRRVHASGTTATALVGCS